MSDWSLPIQEKESPFLQQREAIHNDSELADDISEDSASSYHTALCSLSELGESPVPRIHAEFFIQDGSPVLMNSHSMSDSNSTSFFKAISHQDYKLQTCKDSEVLPFVTVSEQDISSPERDTNVNLQADEAIWKFPVHNPNADELNTSRKELSVKQMDNSRDSMTAIHTIIRPVEKHSSPGPRCTSNSILITLERNQHTKGKEQEHHGKNPREIQLTQKQRPEEGLRGSECRLKRGGYTLGHMEMEEEEQARVVSCRKEQPRLSIKSRNRKGIANSLSTLTATKQKSRLLPHCFSERIPATRHKHQLQRPADTERLEKQSQQGVWHVKPHLSMLYSTKEESTSVAINMGTKLAEPSCEVEGLANLAQVRSSSSITDYMHVLGSSCVPSSQHCMEGNHKYTEDLHAFKMQMFSKTQNTSICSETSSFECVDVALETKEEVKRGLKTVPKRQIQFKRRDTAEGDVKDNQAPLHPRGLFQRQHSTPATLNQGTHVTDKSFVQADRKQKLQKSISLDETSCKTQVASSIITNILSKKMQHEQSLRSLDVSDQANRSATNEETSVLSETTQLKYDGILNREPQPVCKTVKKHCGIISKKQPDKLCLAPLLGGIGMSEVRCGGTEITSSSENGKAEKMSPREEALRLPNLSPRGKISCDSAKGSQWNSSAATNVASSTLASVKTTGRAGQGLYEQHNLTNTCDQEQKAGSTESNLSPTNVVHLISDLEVIEVDSTILKSDDSSVEKEHIIAREKVKSLGQFPSPSIQNQGKPKAPMHVVRDMRSLVKNTYNMTNKCQGVSSQRADRMTPLFQPSINNIINKGERKGSRQDEKTLQRKVTPPLPQDRRTDPSASRGSSSQAKPLAESSDKPHTVRFRKVSPIGVTKVADCSSLNSRETQDTRVKMSKPDASVVSPPLPKTNRTDQKVPQEALTLAAKKGDFNKEEQEITISFDKDEIPVALEYILTSVSEPEDQQTSDDRQTETLPHRSQSSVGPLSACVLTVASTPMVPSYFYKPNLLGYPSIPHGFVQGPILFQTPLYNQATPSSRLTPLQRCLSEENNNLVTPTTGSNNQTQNKELVLSPESQNNTVFITPMNEESLLGGTGVLYPQMPALAAGQTPQQLLLDPETGRYFYMDMPQMPQRKMLFDPETCQYVEVLLPKQTVPRALLSTPCGIPFTPLHMPSMYNPQCVPYVHPHQVFPQQGP